jgi:hypothetical protein
VYQLHSVAPSHRHCERFLFLLRYQRVSSLFSITAFLLSRYTKKHHLMVLCLAHSHTGLGEEQGGISSLERGSWFAQIRITHPPNMGRPSDHHHQGIKWRISKYRLQIDHGVLALSSGIPILTRLFASRDTFLKLFVLLSNVPSDSTTTAALDCLVRRIRDSAGIWMVHGAICGGMDGAIWQQSHHSDKHTKIQGVLVTVGRKKAHSE